MYRKITKPLVDNRGVSLILNLFVRILHPFCNTVFISERAHNPDEMLARYVSSRFYGYYCLRAMLFIISIVSFKVTYQSVVVSESLNFLGSDSACLRS